MYRSTPFSYAVTPTKGDIDPTEGIIHAKSIANEIASSSLNERPTKVYCSPFLRTTHTASIIASRLSKPVYVEDGFYEYLIPSLLVDRNGTRTYPRSVSKLKMSFDNIDDSYKTQNPITEEMFPETESALIERCRRTLDRVLEHSDGENIVIVAHAPCVQALAFIMEGMESPEQSKLSKWPLGGITRFSFDSNRSQWHMDFYGTTEHMPGEYKFGMGLWSLPCFEKVAGETTEHLALK